MNEGWGEFVGSDRRAHYYVSGVSLCRRLVLYCGALELGNDDSPDNCAECAKKLAKRQPPTAAQTGDGNG